MQKLLAVIHQNRDGLTMIELLIVVVIIGTLIAIAIPVFGTLTYSAEKIAVEANLKTIDASIMMYRAEHEGYPVAAGEHAEVGDYLGDYVEDFNKVSGEIYSVRREQETDRGALGQALLDSSDDRPYAYFQGSVGGIDTGNDTVGEWYRLPLDWDDRP